MGQRVGWVGGGRKRDIFPLWTMDGRKPMAGDPLLGGDLIFDHGDGKQLPWGLSPASIFEWATMIDEWKIVATIGFAFAQENTVGHPTDGYHWNTSGVLTLTAYYKFPVVTERPDGSTEDDGTVQTEDYQGMTKGRGFQEWQIFDGEQEDSDSDVAEEPIIRDIQWNINTGSTANIGAAHGTILSAFLTGKFWPQFIFGGQVEFALFSTVKDFVAFEEESPVPTIEIGTCTITTPSASFSTTIFAVDRSGDLLGPTPFFADDTRIDTATVAITASKFREFANLRGDPVYDQETGAELTDPFT